VLHVAQPGHWLRPVTGLGWIELGPAPKIIKKYKK